MNQGYGKRLPVGKIVKIKKMPCPKCETDMKVDRIAEGGDVWFLCPQCGCKTPHFLYYLEKVGFFDIEVIKR